jgi:hypothetical protein
VFDNNRTLSKLAFVVIQTHCLLRKGPISPDRRATTRVRPAAAPARRQGRCRVERGNHQNNRYKIQHFCWPWEGILANTASKRRLTAIRSPDDTQRDRNLGRLSVSYSNLRRVGLADMVRSHWRQTQWLADELRSAGIEIRNDVVINQVLVVFGDEDRTQSVLHKSQGTGGCRDRGTLWEGR